MAKITELSSDNFDQFVKEGTVVVDFWAPWCGPCKRLGPLFEQLSEEMGDIKFAKVNTDDNHSLAGAHGIMSIPTIQLWKNGELVDTQVGAPPRDHLVQFLSQ